LTFTLVPARDQTHFPCEFGANPFSGSQDVSYTNKKQSDRAKNLPEFTACGNGLTKLVEHLPFF